VRVLYRSQVASRANAPTDQLFLLGADPGGKGKGNADGNFGWALVDYKPGLPPPSDLAAVRSGAAQNARQALWAALCAASAGRIVAIGVDGPLGYDADHDRAIDGHIRARLKPLGASPGSAGTTNSLRGACLVQAVAFALLAQRTLGANLLITESYPLPCDVFQAAFQMRGARSARPRVARCDYCLISGTPTDASRPNARLSRKQIGSRTA
jgi:hypothetical protein